MASDSPWGTIRPPAPRTDADVARAAAIEQAVSTLVYIGIAVSLSYLIAKRYQIDIARAQARRMWEQWRHPGKAEESRLIAELRRDISRIEHGDAGRAQEYRGLYEQ